jgi:hypothetical protein
MAKSQLQEAEESLSAIAEAVSNWDDSGRRVIDAPEVLTAIEEVVSDYFPDDSSDEDTNKE